MTHSHCSSPMSPSACGNSTRRDFPSNPTPPLSQHSAPRWSKSTPCAGSNHSAAAIEADIASHHAIADASGNLIYRLILDSLAEIGIASRLRTIGRIGKKAAIEHHAQILGAIERRDAAAAREAMRTHILAAGEDMDLPSLKSRNSK
ncbi:MAG: FCD domain-containing protein [Proteobacteria bacterium]|nr:FCD domain-containing protein [Pseudomonadota bacterium]